MKAKEAREAAKKDKDGTVRKEKGSAQLNSESADKAKHLSSKNQKDMDKGKGKGTPPPSAAKKPLLSKPTHSTASPAKSQHQKEKPRAKAPSRGLSEDESESDDSFIDNEEDDSRTNLRAVLKDVFGYDRKRFPLLIHHLQSGKRLPKRKIMYSRAQQLEADDDLSDMEASNDQIRAEERKRFGSIDLVLGLMQMLTSSSLLFIVQSAKIAKREEEEEDRREEMERERKRQKKHH